MSNDYKEEVRLNEYASVLSKSIPSELQSILDILWKNHKAYIVGGVVRDCLLGFPPKDFDVVTNAHPKDVEKLLSDAGIRTKPIGSKYGTILAIVGKKTVFEVSTFRKEIYSSKGSPEVIFVDSLEEDLARRDFTFNAIAFDPKKQIFIDKYNGIQDIKQGRIQIIGDAHTRLLEDGTRIIRFARFLSQFNLEAHPDLLAEALEIGKNVKFCSYSTLKKEFFKLIMLPDPTNGLRLIWLSEILNVMFPNFPFKKSGANDLEKILNGFKEISSNNIWIRFFGLLLFLSEESDYTVESWHEVGQNLKITPKEQKKLNHLLNAWLNFPQSFESKTLKRWIRATGVNSSKDLLQLKVLHAELEGRSELLWKNINYLKEASAILETFHRSSKD
ncbi:MAG: CCA tRNA nucleotidyltransferase [Promethearchaeota archaeon]